MSIVTMADLTPGTRVRHLEWLETGTIRVFDGTTEIRWDDVLGDFMVSPEGPVFPSDLEIIGTKGTFSLDGMFGIGIGEAL